eukprot:4029313-Amphidinium_carterae.1
MANTWELFVKICTTRSGQHSDQGEAAALLVLQWQNLLLLLVGQTDDALPLGGSLAVKICPRSHSYAPQRRKHDLTRATSTTTHGESL